MKKFIKNNGFTLLELVVAMAIFGGLVMALYAAIGAARRSARDTARKADMQALELDIEDFYGAIMQYPHPTTHMFASCTTAECQVCTGGNNTACTNGTSMRMTSHFLNATTNFNSHRGFLTNITEAACNCPDINQAQRATRNSWHLAYKSDSTRQNYCLYTRLENGQCFIVMPQH
ncbi:MAG: type II secretion system protein [Candidatus Dojkabacteria bacterium]|jgi:prepilin-type N-terminal cleavage/methylation domain-containing protein|nr:type II secretion system protein [Candidatus Dojkabacteria bacterium]